MMKLKVPFPKKTLIVCIFISTLLNFTNSFAQQSLINVNGWNAYVHLPWDYNANPTATYPTIIFFPGTGEVGSNASLVLKYGPGAYISQGWNGNVKIGTDSVKFIVISLQPSALWPIETYIDQRIQTLKTLYRIDTKRLHLTGLSMGGWCATTYVTADKYGGPYTYASQIATVVEATGVRPDDNQPYPNLFDNFANSGGRLLGFEQINDGRDTKTRVDRMNYTKANSGIFVSTNYGGGGHCCWEQFYGGSGNSPNNYTLDGINQNIYQWMARNPAPSVSNANQSPVANAGADKTVTLPSNSVTLNGTGTDPDGTVTNYQWTKVSGPLSGSIKSPASASTSVISLTQGVYLFELQVTDNGGITARDTVQVTVNTAGNLPPTANGGADKAITLPLNTTSLIGTGTDQDGTISSYLWTKLSGPSSGSITNANLSTAVITNLVQGTYLFELKVTDNLGATAKDTMQVIVYPGSSNSLPVADAGPDKSITLPVNYVTLVGTGSDPNGTINGYSWRQISGPSSGNIVSSGSASTVINNLVAGIYQFQFRVVDNSGNIVADTVQVTVKSSGNIAPVADAGVDKSITLPLNTTTLSGSGTDADGYIVSYSWSKISGPYSGSIVNAALQTIVINNLVQGVYFLELVVTDNSGAQGRDTMQITIWSGSANQSPVANAGSDITITSPSNSVTLNGTGTDADGSIASYVWFQVSGPTAKIVSPSLASTSVTNLISAGTYTFSLTVTDDNGATGVDNITVTVNPAAAAPPISSGKRKMIPIAADGGIYFFNNNYLQPGDTGCIQSGTYPYISLSGIVGTATQPITIINCGGQVINTGNNGQSYCYRIVNSRFFKFTGTGAPGINYGFKAYWKGGFTGVGISVKDSTSDYEIDHFEAQNVQNGFLCKIDPYNCDPGTWSTGWTIKNISFHDNYVHNTTGEGYYIINTSSTVTVNDCTGKAITVEPVKAVGVKVYNNICDSTGWDGIQVAASTNALIYNNKVSNYGRSNLNSQQAGIILGGKSNGSIYNNYINNGTGEGLEIFGTGSIYVYNNIISNAGWDGTSAKQDAIAVDDRPQPYNFYGGLQVYVINNTVVNAARNAVHLFNSYGTMATGNRVNNNLLVKPNNTSPYDNPYVNVDGNTSVDTTKNIRLSVISAAGFVNANLNDYHILSTSPAIDKGLNGGTYGVTDDYDGISRPQGTAYDAGAFEYNKGTPPPPIGNQSPVANAGSDKTIQIPVNQVFLDGRQSSDPDGTITTYKWSVVSGPSGSTLLTSTKDTTSLILINAGAYTIQLTVTDNGGLSSSADIIVTLQASQFVAPPANYAKAIHVNIYDGTIPYSNSQWNNWDVGSALSSSNFNYDDNSASGVHAYISGHQRIVDNGSNYSPGAIYCPPPVLQLNSITTSDRDLTVYGLDNFKQYRIELYASRASIVNDTRFTIGSISDTITVANNVNDFAKFDNVSPANGNITVKIQRLNTWQYLAGFSILEQSGSFLSSPATNPDFITQANKTSGGSASADNQETMPDKMLNANIILLQDNMLTIKLNSGKEQAMNLSVVDATGRTFLRTNVTLQKGYNTFNKFIPGITKGIYYIKLFTNNSFVVKPVMNGINNK